MKMKTEYKFYVSNDDLDLLNTLNYEQKYEKHVFSCDDDFNSFIFEKNEIFFLYGKHVLDSLQKDKLFTLNFSATQEIDRIQQAEKTKLETTTQELNEAQQNRRIRIYISQCFNTIK